MMINLVDRLKVRLQAREDALRCFCDQAVQVESWFKGEILVFLKEEMTNGRIQNFDREVKMDPLGKKKVDFSVRFPAIPPVWIELKHWFIGRQRAASYNAGWYFGDRRAYGSIESDVNKLSTKGANGEK